ncbi:acyl-CoA thioesterase [Chlorobium phaeobacteroides]|jgi:acyl-CoA thioester hydrolase|uniref:Thioesterase superfamily protein n=1 Tax=Chlorobium phaeobacteroides (strain DSM 266 / SMG 266 / 2430) TaxID=290317 RepID=A1BJC7_CHLPD|nr:thioesterase family protein [Chlorobium phaeobacteroides]ABL66504.1 thioesterase superfamily protein [Chlorobium phaeobacteroides DSM 266]MBV5319474.1 acyl-CoA thioesterase [Chlorobium phaeobacteroides]
MKRDLYAFTCEMGVRDYECDMQGIVNNSVYQNYLEHVRHEYLKHVGIDFSEYAREGINLVVVRAELDYKYPLVSGDTFLVGVTMRRESMLKFAFYQDIFRLPDYKPVVKAKIIGTALNQRGRPEIPEKLDRLMAFPIER